MKRRIFTTIAGAAVASVIAGIAYATVPDENKVYTACMLKGLGTIRLIDKSLPASNLMSHCTAKEVEISWNQAGQPGAPGPQGAKGEPGAAGTNGTNGADGKDGASVTTASEPAGANCVGGGVQLTAANGVSYVCNGDRGIQGETGATGAQGPKGDKGDTGPAGTNGTNGVSGFEVLETILDVAPGASASLIVACPPGKTVLQGSWTPRAPGLTATAEFFTFAGPSPASGTYHVIVEHESGLNRFPVTVTASASCIAA